MVKPDVVGSKMARARARLNDAEELISVPPDEFLADTKRQDLAEGLRSAVGLRNRIAHGYSTVDHAQIQGEFRQGAETLRRFLARVSSEAGL